jgi:hypothetical protein
LNAFTRDLEKGGTAHEDPRPVVVYMQMNCRTEIPFAGKQVVGVEIGEKLRSPLL